MNNQIKLSKVAEVASAPPVGNGTTPTDADNQAFLDIGQLLFLANTYLDLEAKIANATDPTIKAQLEAEAANTLKEFQQTYGLFHFTTDASGNISVTFDYNEGAQKGVPITYGPYLEIFQQLPKLSNPPTAADITSWQNALYSSTPITWPNGQKQTLLERMLLALHDANFSLADNQDTITDTSFLLFWLSIVNSPGNIAAGTLDDILSEGYFDGAMFNSGNIRAIAIALRDHLANDSTILTPDVVLAGLQIATKDTLYPLLAVWFEKTTPDGSREAQDWMWEALFFPINSESQRTIDALPDRENTYLENQLELEKQALSKKGDADVKRRRITPQ